MKSIRIITLLLFAFAFYSHSIIAQNNSSSGFLYSGELFNDPDWGWSYKTSEQDRRVLSNTHKIMLEATINLRENPGDYNSELNDMSFAFDPKKQEENKAQGCKCITCYYSHNPKHGDHFQYRFDIRLDLLEESESYKKKFEIDDSLSKIAFAKIEKKMKEMNSDENEKKLNEEMEKLRKEIENMDPNNIDEKKLAEIEEKSKRLSNKYDGNDKSKKMDDDTLHAMNGCSYATISNFVITTNQPLLVSEKAKFSSLKNKGDYYYKEITIPGCDFACIYFDKYNKSENLVFSHNPVLIAYIGRTYKSKTELSRQWIDPFCLRITYSGNLTQINEMIKKVEFTKLRQIIQ